MRVAPSRSCRLRHEGRHLAFTADRSRLLLAAGDGNFTVLDGALRILHEGRLPAGAGAVALHPTASQLALASTHELLLATFDGKVLRRWPHRGWKDYEGGSVAFVGDGARLLAVLPTRDAPLVRLLDTAGGDVVAEQPFEVPEPSGFTLVPHPGGDAWALWAGAGQDGQWTFWVRLEGETISISDVQALEGSEHGPVTFDTEGREFLVEVDGGLERRAFPDGRLLGRLEPPDEDELCFSESHCYLGGARALARDAMSSRLHLVDLDPMTLGEELIVDGHEAHPVAGSGEHELCTDLWYLRPLPRGAVLGVHGQPGGPQTLTLLEGPPLFEPR